MNPGGSGRCHVAAVRLMYETVDDYIHCMCVFCLQVQALDDGDAPAAQNRHHEAEACVHVHV